MSGHSIRLSAALEAALHHALREAEQREHVYARIEHLLLALVEEASARDVLQAFSVDTAELARKLRDYLDHEFRAPRPIGDFTHSVVGDDFQRVIRRAEVHVDANGASEIQGANVLIGMFAERETLAVQLLHEQGMTRFDASQYVSHGIVRSRGSSDTDGASDGARPGSV